MRAHQDVWACSTRRWRRSPVGWCHLNVRTSGGLIPLDFTVYGKAERTGVRRRCEFGAARAGTRFRSRMEKWRGVPRQRRRAPRGDGDQL